MKAVIAGGGIGGLTAALCLQKAGWVVDVFEQADSFSDIGAGIQISPNGSRILDRLGVLDALNETAFSPERIEMRLGNSGRVIFSIPLKETAITRWGAPYLHLHRADLINGLKSRIDEEQNITLHIGKAVSGYVQNNDSISAQLADGSQLEADLLVGADGIHSRIREQMLGAEAPRFTGNIAWRATVPLDQLGSLVPPPTACVWTGPGRHAVTYRLRGGTLANFVGVVEQDGWEKESWTEQGRREDVLSDFAGFHPLITNIIEKSDSHYRWALFDRTPLHQWSDGRAVLLGDACHPMLPFLAQGAVMAIEDAWLLSKALAIPGKISETLQRYHSARFPRTSKVQAGARANMKTFHHRHNLAYLPYWLAGKIIPGYVHARQDWLYGKDIDEDLS